jgi:hypothetical protein
MAVDVRARRVSLFKGARGFGEKRGKLVWKSPGAPKNSFFR